MILHECRDPLLDDGPAFSRSKDAHSLPLLGEVDLSNADRLVAGISSSSAAISPLVAVSVAHVEVLSAVVVFPGRHTHGVRLGLEDIVLVLVIDLVSKELDSAATVVDNGLNLTFSENMPFVSVVVEP